MYDVYISLARFSDNGAAFVIHATLCCAAYSYSLLSHNLNYLGSCFLMWEISTPLLYLRWLVLKLNRKGAVVAAANAAFVLSFMGCRVIYGPSESLLPTIPSPCMHVWG